MNKLRLILTGILAFGWLMTMPNNAYANCISYIESQTIAAAYEGDEEPTVHEMDTCSGDDIGYQIPIATTVTFDGVEYENIYATTNSVITFGQPDPTYWTWPNTPSISLYSMDWFPAYGGTTSGLDISYSEGGFQINIEAVPFGNWNAEPSNINILVAITNTGELAISYSYQGPEYSQLRTGVRLHNGDIVTLEEFGATQVVEGEPLPTLEPEPIPEPTPTPTGPTAEEIRQQQEEIRLIQEINAISAIIAALSIQSPQPDPTPSPEPSEGVTEPSEPTPTPSPDTSEKPQEPDTDTQDPDPTPDTTPEPSPSPGPSEGVIDQPEEPVVVEPEIVTPEDPRFPDPETLPTPEPEIPGKPEDLSGMIANLTNKDNILALTPEQKFVLANSLGIKTEEIKLLAEIAQENTNVAEALSTFENRAAENTESAMPYTLADAVTEVQTEALLEDPIAFLTDIDFEELFSPSEWGKDMTDDQREKAQEVIVPVIIASNIVAAAMTRRK